MLRYLYMHSNSEQKRNNFQFLGTVVFKLVENFFAEQDFQLQMNTYLLLSSFFMVQE